MIISEKDLSDKRKHGELKSVFFEIGNSIGFRTWIAEELPYVSRNQIWTGSRILSLKDEKLFMSFQEVAEETSLIDCIWFNKAGLMSAIIEISQGIGIIISLSRMKNFKDKFPPFPTRYVIVAPDEDRQKVIRECCKEQFRDLNPLYFPYSSVEELFHLCQKRKLKGVTEEFLDCYMEKTI